MDDITDVKEDLNDLNDALGVTEQSDNLLNPLGFSEGYYSRGEWAESTTYLTSDYMECFAESVYIHMFNLNNGTLQDTVRTFSYIYWFDAQKNYLDRTNLTAGTTSYSVPDGSAFCRVMDSKTTITNRLNDNKGFYVGVKDTVTWIAYDKGGVPNYVEIIKGINSKIQSALLTFANGVYTITTNHACYIMQRVTIQSKNLDTFRLYSGNIVKGNETFNMWTNSDAEGAIRIQNEPDFVSGYHGSEKMTAYKVFMDGVDVTSEMSIDSDFNTLMFYVESDVYHCYQDPSVADIVAFKRNKIVCFNADKVTISNSYVAQEPLTITSARIALFQCYKTDGDTPVFTDFSVNTDFKDYSVSTVATSKPTDSNKMSEAILNTTYGNIRFKSLMTSGQSYKGSVTDFASQNRIKFYFDTISTATEIQSGEQIASQFEFEIT